MKPATLPPESEASLQAKVMQLAAYTGWRAIHFRPARTAKGWRTPYAGDDGFPDCVLARGGRLIFAELKRDDKEPTEPQREWLDVLRRCPGVEVYCWKPKDFDAIALILA